MRKVIITGGTGKRDVRKGKVNQLNLIGSKEEYSLKLNKSLGSINVDNQRLMIIVSLDKKNRY